MLSTTAGTYQGQYRQLLDQLASFLLTVESAAPSMNALPGTPPGLVNGCWHNGNPYPATPLTNIAAVAPTMPDGRLMYQVIHSLDMQQRTLTESMAKINAFMASMTTLAEIWGTIDQLAVLYQTLKLREAELDRREQTTQLPSPTPVA